MSELADRLRAWADDVERYEALALEEDRQSWLRAVAVEMRVCGRRLWAANGGHRDDRDREEVRVLLEQHGIPRREQP